MLYNIERPSTFDYMVGQEYIVENIRNQSIKDAWFQVYIFSGQFGSGKTTLGRIISLAVNCEHKDERGNPCLECSSCLSILENRTTDVIEIDAASNTGVDSIRDIKESVNYMPVGLKYKVYIIDEVHMLSKSAFNALLKVLEEPPQHVIFVLSTTELNAIPATVRSRAAKYFFGQIPYDEMVQRLYDVSIKHEYKITEDALALISKNSQGSMRNAYTLLEQCAASTDNQVGVDTVQTLLGATDISILFALLEAIINGKHAEIISIINKLAEQGKDLSLMIDELIEIAADAVIAISGSVNIISNTETYKSYLKSIMNNNVEQLCNLADGLMDIRMDLKKSYSKTTVIVGVIRLINSSVSISTAKRIEELERNIKELQSGCISVVDKVYYEDKPKEDYKQDNASSVKAEEKNTATMEDNVSEPDKNPIIEEKQSQSIDSSSKEELPEEKVADQVEDQAVAESEEQEDSDDDSGSIDSLFDFISLFQNDNKVESSCNKQENKAQQKNIVNEEVSSAKKEELEAVLDKLSNDEIFSASLLGCEKVFEKDMLILKTPLTSIYKIIEKYLEVFNITNIVVSKD